MKTIGHHQNHWWDYDKTDKFIYYWWYYKLILYFRKYNNNYQEPWRH